MNPGGRGGLDEDAAGSLSTWFHCVKMDLEPANQNPRRPQLPGDFPFQDGAFASGALGMVGGHGQVAIIEYSREARARRRSRRGSGRCGFCGGSGDGGLAAVLQAI